MASESKLTLEQQCEGLSYLTWDMFDCPKQVDSGFLYMDRKLVQALDRAIGKSKVNITTKVEIGYATQEHAYRVLKLPTYSAHKSGQAVRIRCTNPKTRKRLVAAMLAEGIQRVGIGREHVYFDTDNTQPEGIFLQ